MFDKILVVCLGNICRSPTAKFLLQEQLPHKNIDSAGLSVAESGLSGAEMDSQARSVAENQGHIWASHQAKQLDRDLIKWADLVLVMDDKQKAHIARLHQASTGKVLLLGHWLSNDFTKNISDPYRKSDEAFEHVFSQILSSVEAWTKKIK